jgi:formyltetrahydrofolate synthetase
MKFFIPKSSKFLLCCLLFTNNIYCGDLLEKLASDQLLPAVAQSFSMFIIGFFCARIADSFESKTRKDELESSIRTTLRSELQPLNTKIQSIQTDVDSIKETTNNLHLQMQELNTKTIPVLIALNQYNNNWLDALNNATQAIRIFSDNSLPELEERLNKSIDVKLKQLHEKIDTLDVPQKIAALKQEWKVKDKELDIKLNTYLMQSNLIATSAQNDAREALKQITEMKQQRFSAIPQVIGISPLTASSVTKKISSNNVTSADISNIN